MTPATLPLSGRDRGNLTDFPGALPHSSSNFSSVLTLEEFEQRRREGIARAIPKAAFAQATAAFCLECSGSNPAVTDCEGNLCDCALYSVNTRQKRFKSTKTAIRRAIKLECFRCMGESREACTSPDCALFGYR